MDSSRNKGSFRGCPFYKGAVLSWGLKRDPHLIRDLPMRVIFHALTRASHQHAAQLARDVITLNLPKSGPKMLMGTATLYA